MPLHRGILSHHSKFFDFVNRMLDISIIGGTFLLVHMFSRYSWDMTCTALFLLAVTFFQLTAAMVGLYASQRSYSTLRHLGNVIPAVCGMFAMLTVTTASTNLMHHLSDHMLLVQWFLLCNAMLCGWRLLLRYTLIFMRRHGHNTRKVAIAGCTSTAHELTRKIKRNPWMGLVLDGIYDDTYTSSTSCGNLTMQGDLNELIARARSGHVDHVYIALPMSQTEQISNLVDAMTDSTATVYIIPDVFTFELMNARQTSIDGIPAISIYDSPLSLSDTLLKRSFDILCGLTILAVIALPMLAIACAVKLTSPGPAIFRQRRYGLDGKPIDVWKFRSMKVMDNGSVVRQATRDDDRFTPIGSFLRSTSLDELPQFLNVIQGSMSIVGPRPHAIAHNEEYRRLIKGYMLRHKVKPGITGWAQINGWRGETDTLEKMEKRVEFDLDYIRNWNIWLDIKIVFLTIFKGFFNKNAY